MTVEPLAYRAEEVPHVFPIGRTALFKLIKAGELQSFTVGRSRFITREALVTFMRDRLAEQNGEGAA
ncbi:helix-turn-helix domain-containing protein [Actinomadura sp. 9N407]|uniref:helix-turn-helix domain-containing protein n=1 Tax=Actinomadura sp. 9N407 TaxID=3375154 RepID=UPI0037AF52F8